MASREEPQEPSPKLKSSLKSKWAPLMSESTLAWTSTFGPRVSGTFSFFSNWWFFFQIEEFRDELIYLCGIRSISNPSVFHLQWISIKKLKFNHFIIFYSHVPFRVRVRLSRKRNEDEDSPHKLYTLVTVVPVLSFKGNYLTFMTQLFRPPTKIKLIYVF